MSIYDDINNKLDELYQSISPKEFNWLEDVRKTISMFIKFEKLKDFIRALESVREELKKDNTKTKELKTVTGLLKDLQRNDPDFLIENLKRAGYAVAQNNKSIRDAINREALRMLEQVRLGKRDAVIGMLMRNFTISKIKIPSELVEALKPKYDTNLFRAFIYAFLSGFTITKGIKEEENERE